MTKSGTIGPVANCRTFKDDICAFMCLKAKQAAMVLLALCLMYLGNAVDFRNIFDKSIEVNLHVVVWPHPVLSHNI